MSAPSRPKRQKRKHANNNGGQKVSIQTTHPHEEKICQTPEAKPVVEGESSEGRPVVTASKTKGPSKSSNNSIITNSSVKKEESATPLLQVQQVPSTSNDNSSCEVPEPIQYTVTVATTDQMSVSAGIKDSQNAPTGYDTTPSSSEANTNINPVDASNPFFSLIVAGEIQQATAPDEDGDTPLHIAISQCEVNMVHQLLYLISMAGQSVDPINNLHQTPLHLAIITKQPDLVADLIEAGADPNICDRHGNTSMHLACIHKCAPIMYVLLQSSCTPQLNMKNFEGYIPLHLAVIHGDADIVSMLVRNKPNYIDCKDTKNGWTALFHATARDVEEIIEILLRAGPDINCQSYSGNTALHIASGRGYTEIVRRLMQSGADMSMRNSHRESAAMITTNKAISNLLHGKDYRPRSPTSTSRPSVNIRPPAQPKVTSQSQRSGWPITIISPSEKSFNPFTKQSSVTPKSSSNSLSAISTHILTPPNTQIVLKPAKPVTSSTAPSTSHISQDQIAHLLRAPPRPQSSSKPIQQSPVMKYTEYVTASPESMSAVVSQVTSALKASKSIPVTVLLQEPHGPLELLNAVRHTAATMLSKSNPEIVPVVSKNNEHEMEKRFIEIQSTSVVSQDTDKPSSVKTEGSSEEPTTNRAICNTDGVVKSPDSTANEKMQSMPTSATEDLSDAPKIEANSASLKELLNEEIISKVDCKKGDHADGLSTEVDNLNKIEEIKSEEIQEIDSKKSLNITEKNSEIHRDSLDHSDMLCRSEQSLKVVTSAIKSEPLNSYSETNTSSVEQNNEQSISSCLSHSKSNSVSDISSLEKEEEKDCTKMSKKEVDCLQPDTSLETEDKNIDMAISNQTKNVMTPDEKLSSCKEQMMVPTGDHRPEIEINCTSFVNDDKGDIAMQLNTVDLKCSKLNKGVHENVSEKTSPNENEEMSGNVPSRHQEIQEKLRKHITGKLHSTSKTKIILPIESAEAGQLAGGSGSLTPDEHFSQYSNTKVSIAEKSSVTTDETDKVLYDVDNCDISNEVQKSCVEYTSIEKENFCNPSLQTVVEDSVLSSDIPIQLSGNSNEERGEDSFPTKKDQCVPEEALADETHVAECLDNQVSTNGKQTLSDDIKTSSSMNPIGGQAVSPSHVAECLDNQVSTNGKQTLSDDIKTSSSMNPIGGQAVSPSHVAECLDNQVSTNGKQTLSDDIKTSSSMNPIGGQAVSPSHVAECLDNQVSTNGKQTLSDDIKTSSSMNPIGGQAVSPSHVAECLDNHVSTNGKQTLSDDIKTSSSMNPIGGQAVSPSHVAECLDNQVSTNGKQTLSDDIKTSSSMNPIGGQAVSPSHVAECLDNQVSTNGKQTLSDDIKNTSSMNPIDGQAVSLDGDTVISNKGEKSISNETVPLEREGITQPLIQKQNEIDDVSKSGTVSHLQSARQDLPSSECISADREMSVNACSDASDIDNMDSSKQSTSFNFELKPEIVVTKQQEVQTESTNPCDTTHKLNSMNSSSSSQTTSIGLRAHDDQQASASIGSVKTTEVNTSNSGSISERNNVVLELPNKGSPTLFDTTEQDESSYSKDNATKKTRKRKSPSGRENYIGAEEIQKKQRKGKDQLSEEQTLPSRSKQGTKKDLIIPKKRKIPVEYRTDFDKSMEDSMSKSGTDNLIQTTVGTASIGTPVSEAMQGDKPVEDIRSSYQTSGYTTDENRLDVRETQDIATSMTTNSISQPQSTLSTAQALLSLGNPQPQLLAASKLKQTEESRQEEDSVSPIGDYTRTVVASSNPAKDANLDFSASTGSLEVNPGDRSSSQANPLAATDTEGRRVSVIVYPQQETKKRPKSASNFENEILTKHAHLDVPISRASSTSPRLTIASTIQESLKPQSLTYIPERKEDVHSTRRGPKEDVSCKGALSVPGSDSVNLGSMRPGNNPFLLSDLTKRVPRTSFVTPTSFVYSHSIHPSYKEIRTDAVPHVVSQVPNIVSHDAHIVSQVPHMVSQVTQVPHAVTQGHHFVSNVIPQGPHVVSQLPHHLDSTGTFIISNAPLSTTQGTATHSSNVLPHIALNAPHQLGSIPNPSQLIHHMYPPQGQHHVHRGATPTFIITEPPTHQPGTVLIQQPYQVSQNSPTTHGSKYTPPPQTVRGFPMIVHEPMRRAGELPMVFQNTHIISNTASQAQPMPGRRAYNPYSMQFHMQSLKHPRLHNTTLQTSDPDQPIDLSCKKKPEEPLDMSISGISRQNSGDASSIAHASQGASSSLVHPPLRPSPETSTPLAYMHLQTSSAPLIHQSQRRESYSVRRTVYDGYESDEPPLFIDETANAGDVKKRSKALKKGGKGRHSRLEHKK